MDPNSLGLAMIAIAAGAFVMGLLTRAGPGLRLVRLVSILVLFGLVVVLFLVFFRSALRPLD